MKIIWIKDKNVTPIQEDICAAIGNFDGVHLGHQKLIEESKRHGMASAVFTFYPHPSIFLKKIKNYPLLTPITMKTSIIESLGVDYLIIMEFNEEIAQMSKGEFISLMHKLNIKKCVCGYDFSFGYKGEGHIRDLMQEFDVYEIEKYTIDDVRVGSTYIRELLRYGNIKEANMLLGRTYAIRGVVGYGSQKGRTIGFPTANVCHDGYYLPKSGVYFAMVKIQDHSYFGMCNIGHNPTFNFAPELRLEVHIFDFSSDIYGEEIEIHFVDHIRSEKQFKSKEELLDQLYADKEKCMTYIGGYYGNH